jgi:Cdc6-like AAA superfamily ATPase
MIRVFGPYGTKERKAADHLEKLASEWCPKAQSSANLNIDIFCSVHTPGEKIADIDILLTLWRDGKDSFPPIRSEGVPVVIDNLIGILETKEHSGSKLRMIGTGVEVKYDNGQWKSVTESLKQKGPKLRNYFKRRSEFADPFVPCAALLTSVDRHAMPKNFANALVVAGDCDFAGILQALKADRLPPIGQQPVLFGSVPPAQVDFYRRVRAMFGSEHEATPLTRRRFELVNQKWLANQKYVADVGKKLILITGTAGTGKTVTMLRIGRDLIRDFGHKVVVTSFNTALLNDIRGQIKSWTRGDWEQYFADGHLSFMTIHALTNHIAKRLGFQLDYQGPDAADVARTERLREVVAEVERLGSEIRSLLDFPDENGRVIRVDEAFLLIDEAQDVLPLERDLLLNVFGPERCVVAFSDYQVQRLSKPTKWNASPHTPIPLKKVRRSTALLVEFAQAFASASLVQSDDERDPDREFLGGQIVIVVGDYFRAAGLHKRLLRELKTAENHPTDMLFIVPPGDGDYESAPGSTVASLDALHYPVWNGTRKDVRRTPQTSRQQIRLVNYQSGRGLEAWTVVARGLDTYYDWLVRERPGFSEPDQLLFQGEVSRHYEDQVLKRIMMPLTRPISTLVVELRRENSLIADHLRAAARQFGASVEWIRTT